MEIVNKIDITMDFRKLTKIPMPQINQYDTNVFEFTVLNNGAPADLSNVERIVGNYRRPDKTVVSRQVEAEGNKISYKLGAEEMAQEGLGELNVQLFAEGSRVSSVTLKVYMHKNLGAALEAKDGVTLLQDIFVEVSELGAEAQSAAVYAQNQGDYAKDKASEADAKLAELAELGEVKDEAEAAAGEAQTQATFAKTQGDYAKEKGDLAGEQYERLKNTDVSTLSAQLADIAKLPQNFKYSSDPDDTAMINRALVGGGKVKIPYRPTPYVISSTLKIESGTTLELDEGVIIFLADGSNCRMIENKNKTTKTNLTRVDKNIAIIGGTWDANNSKNPSKWLSDGGTATAMFFSGVENLTVKPRMIKDSQTYSFWACNVKNLLVEGGEVYQSGDYVPSTNRDGIHVQGPSEDIVIKNWKIRSFDDCVAINGDDVNQGNFSTNGTIKNALIENIEMNNCKTGIRLMSVTNRFDDVTVRNIKGASRTNIVSIGSYALGPSDFGKLKLENINVECIEGAPYLIHVNGQIDDLEIKEFTIPDNYSSQYRQGIMTGVDNGEYLTNISKFTIDGLSVNLTTSDNARYVGISSKTTVGTLDIKNNKAFNNTSANGCYPYGISGSIEKLYISDSYFHNTNQGALFIYGSSAIIGSIVYSNVSVPNTVVSTPDIVYWGGGASVGSLRIKDLTGVRRRKSATRDASLVGIQTISGFKGIPKTIEIHAFVAESKKVSIGSYDGGQFSIYANATSGNWKDGTNWAVVIEDSTGNFTTGTIKNIRDGGFDIEWAKGGSGGTGLVVMKIIVTY